MRTRQRENRRIKGRETAAGLRSPSGEEALDRRNCYGMEDLTPYEAVLNIIRQEEGRRDR